MGQWNLIDDVLGIVLRDNFYLALHYLTVELNNVSSRERFIEGP